MVNRPHMAGPEASLVRRLPIFLVDRRKDLDPRTSFDSSAIISGLRRDSIRTAESARNSKKTARPRETLTIN
jgi:hypothetical protein